MTASIEVDASTMERFDEQRENTKTVHLPEMTPAVFLDALLDTHEAARAGYYDDDVAETRPTRDDEEVLTIPTTHSMDVFESGGHHYLRGTKDDWEALARAATDIAEGLEKEEVTEA